MVVEIPAIRSHLLEKQNRFDRAFKESAVRIVQESGRPIAQVARDLGFNEGTLGSWVAKSRSEQQPGALTADEREELRRLRVFGFATTHRPTYHTHPVALTA